MNRKGNMDKIQMLLSLFLKGNSGSILEKVTGIGSNLLGSLGITSEKEEEPEKQALNGFDLSILPDNFESLANTALTALGDNKKDDDEVKSIVDTALPFLINLL